MTSAFELSLSIGFGAELQDEVAARFDEQALERPSVLDRPRDEVLREESAMKAPGAAAANGSKGGRARRPFRYGSTYAADRKAIGGKVPKVRRSRAPALPRCRPHRDRQSGVRAHPRPLTDYDSCVMEHLTIEDLNADTIRRYRLRFARYKPTSTWNELPDADRATRSELLRGLSRKAVG